MRKLLYIGISALLLVSGICRLNHWSKITYEPDPAYTEELRTRAARVQIRRDQFGVPYIHGKTRADAAFGLAYAHAEDDFPTIQTVLAASNGELARTMFSMTAIENDFYTGLTAVKQRADQQYNLLSPELKEILQGYTDGLNYYAAMHPEEADARFFPAEPADIVRGFIHKLPLFSGAGQILGQVFSGELNAEQKESKSASLTGTNLFQSDHPFAMTASNAHAVSGRKSADGITRLNINSHQPWEGPVAWYEAHLSSDDGYTMKGATFPGGPLIFTGHNEFLGWAHTVNQPDLIDVYELVSDGRTYELDGETKELEERSFSITIDLWFFEISVPRTVYSSVHGPVFESDGHYYALRIAGYEKHALALEQWYRMSTARNLQEWNRAMETGGIHMFHTVYADRNNIQYVYNALLPVRKPGFDYKRILPGNRSDLIWKEYMPYSQLPSVRNPPSGFVQNCNSNPFYTTTGPGNPDPKAYPEETGIETRMTNRAIRSNRLLSEKNKITKHDFLRIKFDRKYDKDAPIYREAVNPVLKSYKPSNALEEDALELLKSWDGTAERNSKGAMLAFMTWRPVWKHIVVDRKPPETTPDPHEAFKEAVRILLNQGVLEKPLIESQFMQRGNRILPVAGGPDVLNAVHAQTRDGMETGYAGDSYVMIVDFTPEGPVSSAINVYGASSREESIHYDDQMQLFSKRILRPVWHTQELLDYAAGYSYHPGEE